MMLSGGSTSLDIHVTPEPVQSWISLGFFVAVVVALRFSGWFTGMAGLITGTGLMLVSLAWLALNSHSFTISGRENAFIDRWFMIPTEVVSFDPTGDISRYVVSNASLLHSAISVEDQPETKMVVATGVFGAGIDQADLATRLERFGLSRQ